jgi:hypothetical protein
MLKRTAKGKNKLSRTLLYSSTQLLFFIFPFISFFITFGYFCLAIYFYFLSYFTISLFQTLYRSFYRGFILPHRSLLFACRFWPIFLNPSLWCSSQCNKFTECTGSALWTQLENSILYLSVWIVWAYYRLWMISLDNILNVQPIRAWWTNIIL